MGRRLNPQPPEIRTQLPRGELVQTYRQQILERHEAGKRADFDLREAILRKIELTRQCGQLIGDAKGDLSQKEFNDSTDFLSNDAVLAYLKLARQNPEPVTDLQVGLRAIAVAMMATNALQFPDGHGPQTLHSPSWLQSAASAIMLFVAGFKKFTRLNPVSGWDIETSETFLFSLKPILRIHKEVALHVEGHRGQWSKTQ
jgi:hypothetical protein